jgi:TolB-like protein
MKRFVSKGFLVLGLLIAASVQNGFAQQLPTVAVVPFEGTGGITQTEAGNVTQLFMNELASKGTVRMVDRQSFDKIMAEMRFQVSDWSNTQKTVQFGKALNASLLIRGQVMKMGDTIFISATVLDAQTTQIMYTANTQLNNWGQLLSILSPFCGQIADRMPQVNYFEGVWKSGTNTIRLTANGKLFTDYKFQTAQNFYSTIENGTYTFTGNLITISYERVDWYNNGDERGRSNFSTSSEYMFNINKSSVEFKESLTLLRTSIKTLIREIQTPIPVTAYASSVANPFTGKWKHTGSKMTWQFNTDYTLEVIYENVQPDDPLDIQIIRIMAIENTKSGNIPFRKHNYMFSKTEFIAKLTHIYDGGGTWIPVIGQEERLSYTINGNTLSLQGGQLVFTKIP